MYLNIILKWKREWYSNLKVILVVFKIYSDIGWSIDCRTYLQTFAACMQRFLNLKNSSLVIIFFLFIFMTRWLIDGL